MQTTRQLITRILTLCLLLLAAGRNVMFAYSSEALRNLRLGDGLPGETVYKTMTDHGGRVWIATSSGISVFNGQRLSSFSLNDENGRSLAVFDICQTRDKTIYASTEKGLYRMRHDGDGFSRILPEIEKPESLLACGDTVYIAGRHGFMLYDGRRLTTRMIGASNSGLDNIVRHYITTDDGMVWYLSRFNLHRFNPSTGKTSTIVLGDMLPEKVVMSQFDIVGGKLFLGTTDTGLYVCDLSTSSVRHVSDVGNLVTSVRRTSGGKVCVATDGSGAYLIDAKTEAVEDRYSMGAHGDHALPTNALSYYYRDNEGINWFGMVRYGLAYSPYSGSLFEPFEAAGFSSLGHNVSCYLINGDECLLGTYNGLYFINKKTNKVKYFAAEQLEGGHIVTDIALYKGEYYIGTFDGGLSILNPTTMTTRSQCISEKLRKASVGAIEVDGSNRLWVGCSWGVFILDDDGRVTNFTEQNSHIIGGIIIGITFDGKGNAWLTGEDGISIYISESNEILDDTVFPKGFFNRQSWMKGSMGHDGLIFMRDGTQTFYTDREMKRFGELKLPFRFRDRWCRALVDDLHGHYWVASSNGLFSFNYDKSEMMHFGSGDGLRGDFINDMSLDSDRRLWIATSDGLYTMPTDSLDQWANRTRFKVSIYNIWLGDKLLTLGEELTANDSHRISLPWNFGSARLFINPVLLDYARHKGRLYEYRVDGGTWTTLGSDERIIIDGLMIGTHRLDIRLLGFAGTTSTYTLSVMPTVWALLEIFSFLSLVALLFLWNKYRNANKSLLSERNDIEEALMEVEKQLQNIESSADVEEDNQPAKYQRVKIDEAECADIVARMTAYIEGDKAYANADLKLKTIADVLHLSPSKLSQVFNLYLKENYYDYINRHRLAEFKRLIEAGEHKRITITALSEQCGFRKSNFYSTFRKVEGMSPAEYLKKQGVKT